MDLFDAAEEILFRLPVKDLLRCKSICKSWYALISSPCFVKRHCKFVCNKDLNINNNNGPRRIAMTKRYIIRRGDWCMVPDEWKHYGALWIVGSSNGLVCITLTGYRICLINPSTREFRKLQMPPSLPKEAPYSTRLGFGYDSSTDDYKVVMAINQGCDGTLVLIFSLKLNIWKLFGQIKYRFDDREPGILFNGALHWFCFKANDIARDKAFIVSFDLAKEEFGEIPHPDDMRYVWNYDSTLGIIQDRLCNFHSRNGRPYDIWVMKNYNVKRSWELLPNDYQMKDRVHYMIKDCLHSRKMPTYFCSDNIFLSRSGKYLHSPIFVQTLVSPYVNIGRGRPSHVKNNKRIVDARSGKKMREIEEAHCLEDGEKNELYSEEDGETE